MPLTETEFNAVLNAHFGVPETNILGPEPALVGHLNEK